MPVQSSVQEITAAVSTESRGGQTSPGNPAAYPFTLENCGLAYTKATLKRTVTMNQGATEIMLALGLADKMIGTAYLDDKILPEYQAAYQKIPVLAKEYPSREVLFAAEPDFVYGVYGSAFENEAAGPREELLKAGIASYLSPAACADKTSTSNVLTIDTVYGEIRGIGQIFGVSDRAEKLIDGMQVRLNEVKAKIGPDAQPITIFWFDSGDKEPYAGACCGAPNEIIRLVGAKNIFADVAGNWVTVSWEEVVTRNPEAIVLANAEWSTAEEKIALLKNTPAYADIAAVRQGQGAWSKAEFNIIWLIRLPRVLLALFVGAGLAVVGVSMQATVRNSLADPYLLGISSGASVGAVAVLSFGLFAFAEVYAISLGAFIGSLLTFVLVFLLARSNGRLSPTRLVLAGLAVSYFLSGLTSLITLTSLTANWPAQCWPGC